VLAGLEVVDALADVDVDDDPRLAMAELRAGGAAVVTHAEARGDADRGVVAGIDDGDDARPAEGVKDVAHRGAAGLGRITAAPLVAHQPPADLEIAGRAEGLDAGDADDLAARLLHQRPHADAVLRLLARLAGQELLDFRLAEGRAAADEAHDLGIGGHGGERLPIARLPRADDKPLRFENHSFLRMPFQRTHDSSRAFLLPAYASFAFCSASAAGGGASPARMKPCPAPS
jgi:hypothetical protein